MKILNNKIFKILTIMLIVGFVCGIITYFFIDKNSFNSTLINYYDAFKNNSFNNWIGLFNSFSSNFIFLAIIFIFGFLFFCSFLLPVFIFVRGSIYGTLFISLFFCFKLKGILLFLFFIFPCALFNELIFIIFSYYSVRYANKTYKAIKGEKLINLKHFYKNFFVIFIIFTVSLLFSSLFEIFISSNLIDFIV